MDDAETVILIADEIREINKSCYLICRFFHEEVAAILERPPFNAYVLSTSQNTLNKLIEDGIFNEL